MPKKKSKPDKPIEPARNEAGDVIPARPKYCCNCATKLVQVAAKAVPKRTYQSFLRKQNKLTAFAHKLLVLWAELSSVSIHSVERITCDEEKITVRFRPEEYMPDGVYKLHCARNLSFPASLLRDRYWQRTLKRIYGELKPVQQPFEIGYSLVGQ